MPWDWNQYSILHESGYNTLLNLRLSAKTGLDSLQIVFFFFTFLKEWLDFERRKYVSKQLLQNTQWGIRTNKIIKKTQQQNNQTTSPLLYTLDLVHQRESTSTWHIIRMQKKAQQRCIFHFRCVHTLLLIMLQGDVAMLTLHLLVQLLVAISS